MNKLASVRTSLAALALFLLAIMVLPFSAQAQPAAPGKTSEECQWMSGYFLSGIHGAVYASVVYDDGSGPALYIGGDFSAAGSVAANNIARWDGEKWQSVGAGLGNSVYALEVYDDGAGPALYAGGQSLLLGTSSSSIVKWGGTSWSEVGAGIGGSVYALKVYDDGTSEKLHAGGLFSTAGLVSASRIASWDGNSWSALGAGLDGEVRALEVYDHGAGAELYVGGQFSTAGGLASSHIAKWNGTSWSALPGLYDTVLAMTTFDAGSGLRLFAGGLFSELDGAPGNYLVTWNGSTWENVSEVGGTGLNGSVRTLAVSAGKARLYAAGGFTAADGIDANNIVSWDGSSWSSLGTGVDGTVARLEVYDSGAGAELFVGGSIVRAGELDVSGLASWDGQVWHQAAVAPGKGLREDVSALLAWDDGSGRGTGLLAGGGYGLWAGETPPSGVSLLQGDSWSSAGFTIPGIVNALATYGEGAESALYIGGGFYDSAYGRGIVRWDGTSLQSVVPGKPVAVTGIVKALQVHDDGGGPVLFMGGTFSSLNVSSLPPLLVRGITKWDGTSWSAVGSGMDDYVLTLAVHDDGGGPMLYAGGEFTSAGGLAAGYIAKWDGQSWMPVGQGLGGPVHTLVSHDDGSGQALYAGGFLGTVDGEHGTAVAKWDGTAWTSLARGFARKLYSGILGGRSSLWVAGGFDDVSGVQEWDGAGWTPVGVTNSASSFTMTLHDDGTGSALWLGGDFTALNDRPSSYIAKYACNVISQDHFESGDLAGWLVGEEP